ncbi:uncharacterized protein LOC120152573 [Hibiscus syriacus]|uniref:uncharacterized protein LOC120152573 n=1 Tax=Hibiscus syriacus TaxID=106335 RepID=UPI001924F0EE|nr:uncharacterized protein LOC120152573 [Hibiscus syriacus]
MEYLPRCHNTSTSHVEIVVIIWALWFARNKFYHDGIQFKVEDVVTLVRTQCQDYLAANVRVSGSISTRDTHWQPPVSTEVRINFDACFLQNQNRGWSGVVARDREGYVLGAYRREMFHVTTPFHAEALATLHVVEFATEMGFTSNSVEGDSRKNNMVAHLVESDRRWDRLNRHWVKEIPDAAEAQAAEERR